MDNSPVRASNIVAVRGREILDSRGNPTVEVDVTLADGTLGRAAVPSGASTGSHEAVELRDGDPQRYLGRGVARAVNHVNTILAEAVRGMDVLDQSAVDRRMIEADGTPNKSGLGANAILGISLASAHAAARHQRLPLFRSLRKDAEPLLPVPMMNILNGGRHADNNVDFQEVMIFPVGAASFMEALRMGTEVFHRLKEILRREGLSTSVGDEGGFAPNLRSNREALDLVVEAATLAGYSMGKDVWLALDIAATELFDNQSGLYRLTSEGRVLTSNELLDYYSSLLSDYPIASLEDGFAENDWRAWTSLVERQGAKVQIVGDDLIATNAERLSRAISERAVNAVLIKLNQIGTVTETVEAVELARRNGLAGVISHRSGETEDTTIADLAVALGTGQIKTGSVCRTDRVCKYNQLLRIEEGCGGDAKFAGMSVLRGGVR